MTISTNEKELIEKLDARKDLAIGSDGSYSYWPDGLSEPSGLSSWQLRAIADELDRRNAAWEKQQGITHD